MWDLSNFCFMIFSYMLAHYRSKTLSYPIIIELFPVETWNFKVVAYFKILLNYFSVVGHLIILGKSDVIDLFTTFLNIYLLFMYKILRSVSVWCKTETLLSSASFVHVESLLPLITRAKYHFVIHLRICLRCMLL